MTRISPSLLVASVALAVAVSGGVGYAAGSLPKHSVGAAQLKKKAVTAKAIRSNAVDGSKVADGSLTGADLATNTVTGAQVDESTLTLPAGPGTLELAGSDFMPRNSAIAYTIGGDGTMTSSGAGSFVAPLHLPAGTRITAIRLHVVDNGPSDVTAYVGWTLAASRQDDYSPAYNSSGMGTVVRTLTMAPWPGPAGSVPNLTVELPAGGLYLVCGAEVDYA